MADINDGGPAFACADNLGHQEGMSLRDWFAGQALAGIYASQWFSDHVGVTDGPCAGAPQQSYAVADAMLAERSKKEIA